MASALLPLAGRFADGVPAGVHDLGVEVWSQPDAYAAWPGAADDDPAVAGMTHAELWGRPPPAMCSPTAAASCRRRIRLPLPGLASLTEPLARSGSLVLVAHVSRGEAASGSRPTSA